MLGWFHYEGTTEPTYESGGEGEGGESGGEGKIAQEEDREGLNKGRRQEYSPKLLIG